MSKRGTHRGYFGFEVSARMRKEYERMYGKYQLPISSAMREILRRILEFPESERQQFAANCLIRDAEDLILDKGILSKADMEKT